MAIRILLVEDEETIRDAISINLIAEGYEIVEASNGKEAIRFFADQRFDLAILDVMLPNMSGFEVCEKIRMEDKDIPILFLTARDNMEDKISGLKLGADDYLTKPFNLDELLLRISNLLRRSKNISITEGNTIYKFGNNIIYFEEFKADTEKGRIELTKKEVDLLRLLINRKQQAVSRKEIMQLVWGYDVLPSTRTIDNFLANFRKYFESDPKNPKFFHSIRGVGYKFTD